MTLPNDSIAVTPGNGTVVATHVVDGKEYQVVMTAGPSGHIHDSLPTYYFWTPFAAGAQNQRLMDLFNAASSGVVVKVRKLFIQCNQAAITGVGHVTATGGGTAVTAPAGGSARLTTGLVTAKGQRHLSREQWVALLEAA